MRSFQRVLFLLICFTVSSQSEDHKFHVIHQGKLLGTLGASKTVHDKVVNYKSYTSIEYHLLVAISVLYQYDVTYRNTILNEAKAHIVVRGKDKTKVRTIQDNMSYKFYSEDKIIKTLNYPIHHSIIQLVFNEPIGITRTYAEEHGNFHSIKKIDEHTYLKTAPNGHESTYYYNKDGKLEKSEVDAGIIKFSIVRRAQ